MEGHTHLEYPTTESPDAQREREAREAWQRRQREMDDNDRRQEAEEQEQKRLIIRSIEAEANRAPGRLQQAGYPGLETVKVVIGHKKLYRWLRSYYIQQTEEQPAWQLSENVDGSEKLEAQGMGFLLTTGQLLEYRLPTGDHQGKRVDERSGLRWMILENKESDELRNILDLLKKLG